jgi:hypothetical protein
MAPDGMVTPSKMMADDWVFTTRIRLLSRTYTFPVLSTATATAEDNEALKAGPPSPPNPKIPVPATIDRAPVLGFTL